MELDLWCPRCHAFRILFVNDPEGTLVVASCVFCRGPLVSVTEQIKAEYPGDD